jgi:hypothetical protein
MLSIPQCLDKRLIDGGKGLLIQYIIIYYNCPQVTVGENSRRGLKAWADSLNKDLRYGECPCDLVQETYEVCVGSFAKHNCARTIKIY